MSRTQGQTHVLAVARAAAERAQLEFEAARYEGKKLRPAWRNVERLARSLLKALKRLIEESNKRPARAADATSFESHIPPLHLLLLDLKNRPRRGRPIDPATTAAAELGALGLSQADIAAVLASAASQSWASLRPRTPGASEKGRIGRGSACTTCGTCSPVTSSWPGGDIFTLQRILGHSTPQLTSDTYAHLSPRHLAGEADRVGYPEPAEPAKVIPFAAGSKP